MMDPNSGCLIERMCLGWVAEWIGVQVSALVSALRLNRILIFLFLSSSHCKTNVIHGGHGRSSPKLQHGL